MVQKVFGRKIENFYNIHYQAILYLFFHQEGIVLLFDLRPGILISLMLYCLLVDKFNVTFAISFSDQQLY